MTPGPRIILPCIFVMLSVVTWLPQGTPLLQAAEVVRREKVSATVTREELADGTVQFNVEGRSKPVRFSPSPEPIHPRIKPTKKDKNRGYIIFVPHQQDGVLPEYRPAKKELRNKVQVFASPGEYELATFCIRPLYDLGEVRFEVGPFRNEQDQELSDVGIDQYVLEPTLEHVSQARSYECHWAARWLRPQSHQTANKLKNMQMFVDVHLPKGVPAGKYSSEIRIIPAKGGESLVTLELEVLPLELERPMPWGFFMYNGWIPNKDPVKEQQDREWIEMRDTELRRAGLTQAVVSPLPISGPTVDKEDGSINWSIYDQAIERYQAIGFEDPPILAMEKFLARICDAMDTVEQIGFDRNGSPLIKAKDFPAEVRDRIGREIRRLYDHSLEANWPPFYVYYADEPQVDTKSLGQIRHMEKAILMYSITRQVAPEMRTACTLYNIPYWEAVKGLIDLNIGHLPTACSTAVRNRNWRRLTNRENAMLYGLHWIPGWDTFWQTRRMTLIAEKGELDGLMPWTQWFANPVDSEQFDVYYSLRISPKSGNWFLRQEDGRLWRSLPWMGIREGIDDSRYLRTARAWIKRAQSSSNPEHHKKARSSKRRLEGILARVGWYNDNEVNGRPWDNAAAHYIRRDIAKVALRLKDLLEENKGNDVKQMK